MSRKNLTPEERTDGGENESGDETGDRRPCDCCAPDDDLPGYDCFGAAHRARCPECGVDVRAVATVGPDEHRVEPCGHRVSGAYVEEFRAGDADADGDVDA